MPHDGAFIFDSIARQEGTSKAYKWFKERFGTIYGCVMSAAKAAREDEMVNAERSDGYYD